MSIFSKMILSLAVSLYLIFVCVLGAFTCHSAILVPFIFTVVHGCSYIFWKINNHKFPFYFHIGLLFLLTNNQVAGVESAVNIVKWGFLFTFLNLVRIFIRLRKQGVPLYSADNLVQGTFLKYKNFFKENPTIIHRTFVHCLIIFAVSWVGYLVYDQRGYWLMLSASAVLIGGDYGKISIRGKRRIAGTFVCIVFLGGLVFFNANTVVLIAVMVISMIGINYFMPSKYIMGSACIGINAVTGNILISGDLSYAIVGQRVLWTIIGAVLTLMLCYVFDKLLPWMYQDYTKEKLIVAKN